MSHYESDSSDSSGESSSGHTRRSSSSGRSTRTKSSTTSHATIKDKSKAIWFMKYTTGANPNKALALRKTKVREREEYNDYNDEIVYFNNQYTTYAWVAPKFDDSASQFGSSSSGRSSRRFRQKKSQPRFVPPQRPQAHFQPHHPHPQQPPNHFMPPPPPGGGDAGFINLSQGPPPGGEPAFIDLNAPPAGDPWRNDGPPMMGGHFRPAENLDDW